MAQHGHGRHSKSRSYKNKKKPVALIIIICVLAVLIIGAFLGLTYLKGDLRRVKINKNNLGIVETEDMTVEKHKIVNIAVFGVDTRDESAAFDDQNRSDSIIILSVDRTDNSIKIISVLRDSKVPIEGYEPQKINAAYKYGRAPLAIKTLNQNFKLNIKDYVSVDFGMMEQVIDLLGGVDVTLTQEEADLVNAYADGIMGYKGYDAVEGNNTLNGAQAVSFSRIRSIDSDYQRAGRQRVVLKALFAKLRTKSATQYPQLIRDFMGCVETSLSYSEILSLATGVNLINATVTTYSVPDGNEPELWSGIDDTGSWVWIYDLDQAADRIHMIIYGGGE
ncbi:MAG: LCP family protein [Lachnospiraceae bacterium]|nr:LCP family protein [Lachnospiraceae bacterium]